MALKHELLKSTCCLSTASRDSSTGVQNGARLVSVWRGHRNNVDRRTLTTANARQLEARSLHDYSLHNRILHGSGIDTTAVSSSAVHASWCCQDNVEPASVDPSHRVEAAAVASLGSSIGSRATAHLYPNQTTVP